MSANIFATMAKDQYVPTRTGVFSYVLVSRGTDSDGNGQVCDSYANNNDNEQPTLGTTASMADEKQYLLCCHHHEEST
jgi:hypothetical protein